MKRTVLISGAGGAIGQALARAFADKGYNLVLTYNNSYGAVRALSEEFCAKEIACQLIQADFNDAEQVMKVKSQCCYNVDTLINNAGIAHFSLIDDDTAADFDRVININLKSAWTLCRDFLPQMRRNGFGRIINISSFWARRGSAVESLYCMSKAGLEGLTLALARECPPFITVNAIAAGLIDSPMNKNVSKDIMDEIISRTAARRIGTPDDIAAAALFLAEESSSFITGNILNADGGYN